MYIYLMCIMKKILKIYLNYYVRTIVRVFLIGEGVKNNEVKEIYFSINYIFFTNGHGKYDAIYL